MEWDECLVSLAGHWPRSTIIVAPVEPAQPAVATHGRDYISCECDLI